MFRFLLRLLYCGHWFLHPGIDPPPVKSALTHNPSLFI